jgi:hypothetical protein
VTRDRGFKRLVRARRLRTGESYTAARAACGAAARDLLSQLKEVARCFLSIRPPKARQTPR